MQKTPFQKLLAAALFSCLLASAGCATSDINALRGQLADVQKIAMDAQQQAKAASEAAAAAKNLASTAQSSADQAKTMSRATEERLTQMKQMKKKR